MKILRLGILGSGKGSNFVALQEAILAGDLSAKIQVVVSDVPTAGILDQAQRYGLPHFSLPASSYRTKLDFPIETGLAIRLQELDVEWVVLAGYLRVIKAPLLQVFKQHIVNIHPSLLPAFKGLEAWRQALAAGVSETGCTVHLVNAEIDAGQILGQARVPIYPTDTPSLLHARIQEQEHRLYPVVLQQIARGQLP
jgi:phosphoribosylglycinamide formyltransferase 1